MLDRHHLAGIEGRAVELDDHRGARFLLVAAEHLAPRQHQMDPRRLDLADRRDGARQFALERAHMIDALDEIGRT